MTGKLPKDDPSSAGPTITLTAMIPFLFVCFVLLSDMNRAFMLVSLVIFFYLEGSAMNPILCW